MKAAGSILPLLMGVFLEGCATAQPDVVAQPRPSAQDDASAKKADATIVRDAERFASCTKALDTECVVALSDAQAYERLSAPGFHYKELQAKYFADFKQTGSSYTRFELTGNPVIFEKERSLYSFVPYHTEGVIAGKEFRTNAYLIGHSPDGGRTWKFVDGTNLSIDQVRMVIPSYDGQPPLPAVHVK